MALTVSLSRSRILALALVVAALITLTRDGLTAGGVQTPTAAPPPIVLTGAWLIDGTGAPAVDNAWIRIEGDQIAAVGQGSPPPARGAQIIDLRGRTVFPGLSDMHVHLRDLPQAQWMLKLLLAHGVTNVKETGNSLGNLSQIRRWIEGEPRVPHVYMSGATLNGSAQDLEFLKAGNRTRQLLEDNGAFGVEFLKIHNWISSGALRQIAEFAKANNIYLTGHVPLGMTSVAAIDGGMTILEHVRLRPSEIGTDPEIEARYPLDLLIMQRENHWAYFDPSSPAVQRTLDAWTKRRDRFFIDPTLAVHEALAYGDDPKWTQAPEMSMVSPAVRRQWNGGRARQYGEMTAEEYALAKKAAQGQARFIGMAHTRGIRVLTGTDTSVNWVIPGLSLLHELELLVAGGLSPVAAIHASTGVAAEALRSKDRGVIAAGKVADLVIAQGNVASDIRSVRQIEKVMLGGQLHERAALLEEAARHAARHAAPSSDHP